MKERWLVLRILTWHGSSPELVIVDTLRIFSERSQCWLHVYWWWWSCWTDHVGGSGGGDGEVSAMLVLCHSSWHGLFPWYWGEFPRVRKYDLSPKHWFSSFRCVGSNVEAALMLGEETQCLQCCQSISVALGGKISCNGDSGIGRVNLFPGSELEKKSYGGYRRGYRGGYGGYSRRIGRK